MPLARKFNSGFQMVAATGTQEPISGTIAAPVDLFVSWVRFEARQQDGTVNAGDIVLGDSEVALGGVWPEIPAGTVIEVHAPIINGEVIPINLADIFVDAANNDDGVCYWYVRA